MFKRKDFGKSSKKRLEENIFFSFADGLHKIRSSIRKRKELDEAKLSISLIIHSVKHKISNNYCF